VVRKWLARIDSSVDIKSGKFQYEYLLAMSEKLQEVLGRSFTTLTQAKTNLGKYL
jgi:hypothetical protein